MKRNHGLRGMNQEEWIKRNGSRETLDQEEQIKRNLSKGVDQEERTKRNRWLGKEDQSSQKWSFTITVQAANSSAVSKAGSPW